MTSLELAKPLRASVRVWVQIAPGRHKIIGSDQQADTTYLKTTTRQLRPLSCTNSQHQPKAMSHMISKVILAYLTSASLVAGLDSSWTPHSSTPDSYTCTRNHNAVIADFKKNLIANWVIDPDQPGIKDQSYYCSAPSSGPGSWGKDLISKDGKYRAPGSYSSGVITGCWNKMQVSFRAQVSIDITVLRTDKLAWRRQYKDSDGNWGTCQ